MDQDKSIWQRYMNGTATEAELRALYEMLEKGEGPYPEEVMNREMEGSDLMPAQMAERLRKKLEEAAGVRKPLIRRSFYYYAGTAAAVLFLFAGYALYLNLNTNAHGVKSYGGKTNTGNAPQLVVLPDQSKVWVNKNSTLLVSEDFANDRSLQLEGEAYFEVTTDPKHPLTIESGGTITQVLGTTFNIDNNVDGNLRITLISGAIKVSDPENSFSAQLKPGETLINKENKREIVKTGSLDVIGWMHGNMIFNQIPLKEALKRVSEHYNKPVFADDSLLSGKVVTADYPAEATLEEVLNHMLFIYQLKITKDAMGNIVITSKP